MNAAKDASSTIASEEDIRDRSKDVTWYCKELEDVPQQMRELLEKYSNISPERVSEHICSFVSHWSQKPFQKRLADLEDLEGQGLGNMAVPLYWRLPISVAQPLHDCSVSRSHIQVERGRKASGYGLLLWTRISTTCF